MVMDKKIRALVSKVTRNESLKAAFNKLHPTGIYQVKREGYEVEREAGRGRKRQNQMSLVWIFSITLTWAVSLPASNCYRQWHVRHASAGVIGRLMRWHQAHEWLIGLMRITVCKCFFIPLWPVMQQIFYLY